MTRVLRQRSLGAAMLLMAGAASMAPAVAGPATAAGPVTQPTRDVDVTYKVPVPGVTVTNVLQRLRFSPGRHMQRLDMPTSGNWMLLDFQQHTMSMVREQSHEIVDVAAPDGSLLPGGGAGFVMVGPTQVNGLACTEWRAHDSRGNETVACYTDDGVLLRARNVSGEMLEAVDVKYGTLPDGTFDLPKGFSHQAVGAP